ncbi:MAG TPA: deaminase [Streptosporangiaceae bacterium]|nr:deaminase [Streptosporangiaceae bacterium]
MAWRLVSPAWRACLEEAWASWRSGSLGVGAVTVDEAGRVVTRGRNREGEHEAPPGALAGSYLAHAEVNALAALPRRRLPGLRLLTSLAPCLMCASAIIMTGLRQVEFAAADPVMADVPDALAQLPFAAGRAPERIGPLHGPVREFAELLPVLHMAEFRRQSRSLAAYRARRPALVDRAERLLGDGTARALRTASCPAALDALLG